MLPVWWLLEFRAVDGWLTGIRHSMNQKDLKMKVVAFRVMACAGLGLFAFLCQAVAVAQTEEKYESAEYKVLVSEGKFEVREYPDLMLAAVKAEIESEDAGGGFMMLFRFISGANKSKQKIAMTTPVFMEGQDEGASVQMGFVMPKEVAAQGVPQPTVDQVKLRKRPGGRFAVVQFSGQMSTESVEESEEGLRAWMKTKGLEADDSVEGDGVETAIYDSPFTPGPKRRNELLVRLKAAN